MTYLTVRNGFSWRTDPPIQKGKAMVYTLENIVASGFRTLMFWTFALSPVWVFFQLLVWAGRHLPG